VVERAQSGRYHRIEINRGLPARFVVRYFDHQGEDWFAKPELKKMCNFRQAISAPRNCPSSASMTGSTSFFCATSCSTFSADAENLLSGIHRLLAPMEFSFSAQRAARRPFALDPVLAGGTCYFKPPAS